MKRKPIHKDIIIRILAVKLLKISAVLLILFFAWSAYDGVANSNAYTTKCSYQIVYVNKGDTIWSIAAKHAGPGDDIREIVMAIKQLNNLPADVMIHPGQTVKIPLKYKSKT